MSILFNTAGKLRFVYKVLIAAVILLAVIFSIIYFIFPQYLHKAESEAEENIESAAEISEEHKLLMDYMNKKLDELRSEYPQIKGAKLATESAHPIVWIFMDNIGVRRDNFAADCCQWLISNGIQADRVILLDDAARAEDKMIDIGEQKCN